MLEATNVSKRYGQIDVLKSVSLKVPSGSAVIVLGPSGGGKSTLIRTLSCLEEADEGIVTLDGKCYGALGRCSKEGYEKPWPDISVVFQQLFLWPHLTIRKNVEIPAKLRGRSVDRLDELAELLGIARLLGRYPNEISIGQRQRAALIRAVLLEPKFLLLDEITAALDVEQVVAVLDLLVSLVNAGMGLVVVTHHFGFARSLLSQNAQCRFAFLENGSIVEAGDLGLFQEPNVPRFRAFLESMKKIG